MIEDPTRETTGSPPPRVRYLRVRNASIRGAGAGVVAVASQAVLRIGSIAVLARLLTPEEFGVAAMAGILLNLFALIGDWGLTTASTQRLTLDHDQLSKLFWINAAVGMMLAGASTLFSPLLALLFGEPRVIGAAIVLSLTVIAIGLGAQHEALMRRQLKYDTLQFIRVASHALGITVGVVAAFLGAGFWALIGMQVTTQIVRTALYWIVSGWKPSRPHKSANIRPLLRFATVLVPSRLLFYLSRNSAPILLGTFAGAAELGLYNRASTSVMTPVSYLLDPLERVVPSSLSRLQEDATSFARLVAQAMMVTALGGCGVLALLAAEAPAFVTLLLGDQWLAAIPLVRWLTLAGSAWVVGKAIGWVLVPLGAAEKLLTVRVIRVGASVAGVIIGWQWGPIGVAAGYSIATVLSFVVEVLYAARGTPLRIHVLIRAAWRPILSGLAAAGVVFLIRTELGLATFLLEVGLYCTLFLSVHALLPGGWDIMRTAWRAVSSALTPNIVA